MKDTVSDTGFGYGDIVFGEGGRKVTKAMFMAAVTCPKHLYNLLYSPQNCPEKEKDLTVETAARQVAEMGKKLFEAKAGAEGITEIPFGSPRAMTVATEDAVDSGKKVISGAYFADSKTGCVCRMQWCEVLHDGSLRLSAFHVNTEAGEKVKFMPHLWNLAYQVMTAKGSGTAVSECVLYLVDNSYRKPKRGQKPEKYFLPVDVSEAVHALTEKRPSTVFPEIDGTVGTEDILDTVYRIQDIRKDRDTLMRAEALAANLPMPAYLVRDGSEMIPADAYGHCTGWDFAARLENAENRPEFRQTLDSVLSLLQCGTRSKALEKYLELSEKAAEPVCQMGVSCLVPFECGSYGHCLKVNDAEGSAVMRLTGARKDKKFMLLNAGFRSAAGILGGYEAGAVKLNGKQIKQLEYEITPGMKDSIEQEPLTEWFRGAFGLKASEGPGEIYFLDFETFQFAVPPWRSLAPYDKVPFQFSLHVLHRDTEELEHFEFLARKGKDPRRRCAELLCRWIPADGTGVAYNMGFEKSVLHALADLYPDLSEHLNGIADGMQDLMIPFQKQWFYRSSFMGKYSIKYILPGLFPDDPSLNYHNLEEVQNGVMAMGAYLKLMQDVPPDEHRLTRKHMLCYCALDTFAMVKIYWYLLTLIREGFSSENTETAVRAYDGYTARESA